jgi:hypothetical protein
VSGSNAYSGGGSAARADPRPAATARAALPAIRAAASRALPRLCGFTSTPKNSPGAGLTQVEDEAAVEDPLRPGASVRASEPARGGDADQRLLREPQLLGLVRAPESQAGVPAQVSAWVQ